MNESEVIENLQETIRAKEKFNLYDYFTISDIFLNYIESAKPTRIVSPYTEASTFGSSMSV